LEKKKPVITCGDFNVAYAEIDLKNPKSNKTTDKKSGSAGFTDKERQSFEKYFDNNFIDTYRYLYPEKIQYS
jgi:exodeoxyribonuclease-3